MDVTPWYEILGAAIIIIAIISRFLVYRVLVSYRGWLPEKATGYANIISAAALAVGIVVLLGKAVFSRGP